MLKAQVEKQATRIDALMRESQEAVTLRHMAREQAATLEQLSAAASGTDDSKLIIAQLRGACRHGDSCWYIVAERFLL